MNYSKILIQEITRAPRSRGSCRDPRGMRLSPEPELPDQLTGVCDRLLAVRMKTRGKEFNIFREPFFREPLRMAPFLRLPREVKLSALRAIPTTTPTRSLCVFNHLGMARFLH